MLNFTSVWTDERNHYDEPIRAYLVRHNPPAKEGSYGMEYSVTYEYSSSARCMEHMEEMAEGYWDSGIDTPVKFEVTVTAV